MSDVEVDIMFKLIRTMEDSAGLSLVEVVIASLIISISVMGSYALFAGVIDSSAGNSKVLQAQQEARITMERMARELRESSADRVWTREDTYFYEPMVMFLTPRDQARTFVVDEFGDPEWQRVVLYRLDLCLNRIYRHESYEPYIISSLIAIASGNASTDETYEWLAYEVLYCGQTEELGGNGAMGVMRLDFSRDNDKLLISMRAAPGSGRSTGDVYDPYMSPTMNTNTAKQPYTNVADAYIHLSTTVRLRN